VVVAVNGHAIRSSSELTREVAKANAGDILRLDVIREGKRRTIDIRSGVRPSERELAAANENAPGSSRQNTPSTPQAQRPSVLGMSLGPLDAAARQRHRLEPDVRGVVIENIDPASDAAERGLRRGDVLVRAGDRNVASAADVTAAVEAAKKAGRSSILVGVHREGRTLFLPLKVAG